jgi:antitoxin component of MazEF toxin-antitoxin module
MGKDREREKMNETNDSATIQEIGEDLVVIIPNHICEKLGIKEGSEVIVEPFFCSGEAGIRIKLKT